MIEMKKEEYHKVLDLFHHDKLHYPLLKSILINAINAKVFTDIKNCFTSVFIIGDNGWCYLIGDNQTDEFINDILSYIKMKLYDENQDLLWFGITDKFRGLLDYLDDVTVFDNPRYRFKYMEERILPTNHIYKYNISVINNQNIDKFIDYCTDFYTFWKDKNSFLTTGIGFIIRENKEIIAYVMSAGVVDSEAEINIYTTQRYRKKGMSSDLLTKYMDECNRRKIIPKWDCSINNSTSINLAAKFGFKIIEEYNFSYIKVGSNPNSI